MAWLNASGNPVATQPTTVQIDVPCETASDASIGAMNWMAVILAVMGLVAALKSGDPMAVASAIQALIKAITGGGVV